MLTRLYRNVYSFAHLLRFPWMKNELAWAEAVGCGAGQRSLIKAYLKDLFKNKFLLTFHQPDYARLCMAYLPGAFGNLLQLVVITSRKMLFYGVPYLILYTSVLPNVFKDGLDPPTSETCTC